MKPIVDFSECLKDSPKFRNALEDAEDDLEQLEMKLEKLVKLCTATVESGKAYMNSKVQFVNGIKELVFYFKDDALNVNALNKLTQALQEMDKYQSILIDQAKRTVCKNLADFIHSDIRKAKETKRCFEKYSDEFDQALIRNSQVQRSKQHECEEANNIVTAARSGFQHTALDYIFQVSLLQSKKRYEVLDTLLSYTRAHSTFFHQGSDLCQDVDPFMKQLAGSLSHVRDEASKLERSMDDRHSRANDKESSAKNYSPGVQLEGYLFKRTSNAFKSWKRRWFVIKNHQLVYCKRSKDTTVTVMEEDLRICTVKPVVDIDRRFCFEVLSPSKSHTLQADSEEMYNTWVTSMQAGIDAALHHTMHGKKEDGSNSSKEDLQTEILKGDGKHTYDANSNEKATLKGPWEEIVAIDGNGHCCDCNSLQPQWASINLGITLCIECSGIHRSLGVHHSKVRSLRLDDWDPELVKLMKELGNTFVNSIYEATVDESFAVRPTSDSPSNVREAWIKAKYIQKCFVVKQTNRAKLHLFRKPNIRHLRRPSFPMKAIDRSDCSLSLLKDGSKRNDLAEGDNSLDGDIPSQIIREKKHSIVSSPEFYARRTAGIFDILSSTSNANDIPLNRATLSSSLMPEPDVDLGLHSSSRILMKTASVDTEHTNAKKRTENEDSIAAGVLSQEQEVAPSAEVEDFDEYSDEEDDIDPNLQLYRSSGGANLHEMCKALARGANVSWVNVDDGQRCPIHEAISSGSVMACEYLLLNGAKIDSIDSQGKTPLHFASDLGFTGQVCLLLKRGADQKAKDTFEKDPLSYAVDNANADIVTLLRLAKLNEEMKETEFGNSDETFNEVVRDFSQRASSAPDRIKWPSLGSLGDGDCVSRYRK